MLELQTFGGLVLRTGAGERVEALAGRTKGLALLAYLAVEAPGGRVPREEVASLLWPGRPDGRARASLRAALSQIRQATEPVLVVGEGAPSLGLARDHVRADVTVFREALEAGEERRALELYGGEFLAGVRVDGARRFQRWADRKRGHFRQRAYEAALSVGASARKAGDLASAEHAFRRALDLGPLREEAARELIETLADRGRPADAVQLFEAFRERREAELEMAPSEQLRERVAELKRAPPAASGAGAERVDPASPGAAAAARGTSDPEPGGGPPGDAAASAGELEGGPSPAPGGLAGREPSRWERFRRRFLLGALVAVGLLGAALAGAWHLLGAGGGPVEAAAGGRSVAVLPFETIGTEDPGPIAAGLHSDLLTRLSAVGDLEVISSTSVERFRGADLPLPAIADSLGVTWVLEGHVQQAGEGIEVHAQLIDPRTDTHAWAETYRRELTAENLFELQSDITRRIAGVLETRLTGGEEGRLDRRTTGSLEAHRFYVRGRSLLEQRETPEMRRALDYFEQALARDSSYALAWAGKADALSLLAHRGGASPDTALPAASDAARRALELEPDLAEAHVARGRLHLFRHDGPEALRDLQRAVELKPSYSAAHGWLGKLLLSLGRPQEALASVERAVQLNPLSAENQATLVWACLANGQYERALRAGRRASELRSGLEEESNGRSHYEVLALTHLRRLDELKVIDREDDQALHRPFVAFSLAESGNPEPARRLLRGSEENLFPLAIVLLNVVLGNQDRALAVMRRSFPREEGLWEVGGPIYLRYFWPETLDPLRDDPSWDGFIAEVNTFWGLNPDGSLPEGPVGIGGTTETPSWSLEPDQHAVERSLCTSSAPLRLPTTSESVESGP